MKALSDQAFEAVTQMFQRVSGIQLGPAKRSLVNGRLQKLAQDAGDDDVEAYAQRLVRGQASHEEMTRLVDRLTTNETYFFREPQHFEHLTELVAALPPKHELQVWSAASSSGEEAYSIAMLLADKLGEARWQITGTDLSTAVLRQAERGIYPMERARMTPPDYLKRFCLKGHGEHEGTLLVARSLRARVRFVQANLMQPLPDLPMFDVIFLRNVLIYFDNASKRQIVRRVLERLAPAGVLYTGHAESLGNLELPIRMLRTAVYTHG